MYALNGTLVDVRRLFDHIFHSDIPPVRTASKSLVVNTPIPLPPRRFRSFTHTLTSPFLRGEMIRKTQPCNIGPPGHEICLGDAYEHPKQSLSWRQTRTRDG